MDHSNNTWCHNPEDLNLNGRICYVMEVAEFEVYTQNILIYQHVIISY